MDKRVVAGILAVGALIVVVGVSLITRSQSPASEPDNTQAFAAVELTSKDWVKGNPAAEVTVLEYGDFQCPACKAYYPLLKDLAAEYPDKLRIVFRQFPLTTIHDKAYDAAKAAESAGLQGKFWEMHDKLFENQDLWAKDAEHLKRFEEYAVDIGLVVEKWLSDVASPAVDQKVQADRQSGGRLAVTGTPTFFVNGQKIDLPGSYDKFKAVIEDVSTKVTPVPATDVHMHFDVAIFREGKRVELSGEEFMEKNDKVHFHDGNGEVAHIHKSDATLGMFVESLDLDVKSMDSWMILNGMTYDRAWSEYRPQDLDRIVLTFGENEKLIEVPEGVIRVYGGVTKQQLDGVTDKACIYSEKCPERGTPPTENCVGGLETPCE